MKSIDIYKPKEQFYFLKLIDRHLDLALAGEILNNGTMVRSLLALKEVNLFNLKIFLTILVLPTF